MKFDNSKIRRQDRLLDEHAAAELLRTGEYGVLSLQAVTGGAYGVPVSYVWDEEHALYVHCAPEGRKLRCLAACGRVSFCVVGRTEVIGKKYTMAYESVILQCSAKTDLLPRERREALALLLKKYSADYTAGGMRYAEKSFHRTHVIRLDVQEWSGKCKRVS